MQNLYPKFSDIYGQDEAVNSFRELFTEIKLAHIYKMYNEQPSKGYLLSGPKGVGKTSCIRALANELELAKMNCSVFHLSYIDIANSFLDRPLQNLKSVFKFVEELSQKGHVIFFIDEIDIMFPAFHDHMHEQDKKRVNVFLEWMDGGIKSTKNITMLGATNDLKGIHNSILRPGRFDKVIQFHALKPIDIWNTIVSHLEVSKQKFDIQFNYKDIIHKLENYNGADAKLMASRIIKHFIKLHIEILDKNNISYDDLDKALTLKPELNINLEIFESILKSIKPSETRIMKPIGFNLINKEKE